MSPESTPLHHTESELPLPDASHFELKDHLERGNIPLNTSLGQAAMKELTRVGVDVIIPPSVEDEAQKQARAKSIVDALEDIDNSENKAMFNSEDAMLLIEYDYGKSLVKNLENFQGLDYSLIANKLIEVGRGYLVVGYLDKFQNLDYIAIVNKLIDAGKADFVVHSLYKFQGLDTTIAEKLIENGDGGYVAQDLDKFQDLDYTVIASKLIETGQGNSVAEYLDSFQGIDHLALANGLIDAGKGDSVAVHLYKFQGLDHTAIAEKLIEAGKYNCIAKNLQYFRGLDATIASKLIDAGEVDSVAGYIYKFIGLDTAIAEKLIEAGKYNCIAKNLQNFTGLDATIADELIKEGEGKSVIYNINKFQGLDYLLIANKLIEDGKGGLVVSYLENFPGLDHAAITNKLIEDGEGHIVADFLDNFQGLNHTVIAEKLIEAYEGDSVAKNLDKFQDLDHTIIANKLIETGNIRAIVKNFNSFKVLPGDKILNLLEFTEPSVIKSHLFRFIDIPDDALSVLREKLSVPELTNLPRPWTDENGELHRPPESSVDRWYGDLSYVYMEGGFNKTSIGRLIRTRIEKGLSDNIHDASQWLSNFRIPEMAYDVEAIQRQKQSGSPSLELIDGFRRRLIDDASEMKFFNQLLSADQNLRDRLNYEGVRRELSSADSLTNVFSLKPELKNEFNQQLGRDTAQMTESFNDELLNNPVIRQQYDEALVSGVPRRKFFKDYLKNNPNSATDFNRRYDQLRNNTELSFYNSVIANHPELSDKTNESNEATNNESWFFDPIKQLLFRAAVERIDGVAFYKHADFSVDSLFSNATQMADSFRQSTAFGVGKDESSHNLSTEQLIAGLKSMRESGDLSAQLPVSKIGETVQTLAQARLARSDYIKDTQSWLIRHSTSPQGRLTKVWSDRAIAIASGESDNAKDIELWQNINALRISATALDSTGELQSEYKLSYDEVMGEDSKPVRRELGRRLSSENIIEAMSKLKRWGSRREKNKIVSLLPAASMQVEINDRDKAKAYTFDILDKNDPRGFTIGEDTYCCMTINGASRDCIKAGYTKENCGFVAVYNNEHNMIAQSYWFINKDKPNVLVMDNIEANKGQDLQKVADVYRQALINYIKDHPEIGINKVHVGTEYTDINLDHMPIVDAVPLLKDVDYSDAETQRLLLDLSVA